MQSHTPHNILIQHQYRASPVPVVVVRPPPSHPQTVVWCVPYRMQKIQYNLDSIHFSVEECNFFIWCVVACVYYVCAACWVLFSVVALYSILYFATPNTLIDCVCVCASIHVIPIELRIIMVLICLNSYICMY